MEFCHGFGQNLLVGFVAEVGNETALLGSQQVAGTTDVEVLHGNVYAGTEVGKVLDGLQTPAAVVGKGGKRRGKKVTERLSVATTYTSAHLMKVGKTEMMRRIDDDGVGIGDINAVLHDGGGDEDIVFLVDEIFDDFLQLFGRHLAMSDGNACIGDITADKGGDFLKTGDAMCHDIYLSVAREFEIDGIGNDFMPEGMHLRKDGIPVGRRSANDAQVAGSHQRELQRTRYGCGTHGQRVDRGLHLPEFFLDTHPEFLFFINNQQPKVLELHRLADEFVGTDKDVYLALCQVCKHLPRLLGGAGTGKIIHTDRKILQTFGECLEMLVCKYGGRHHHCHLFVVAGSLECGSNSNLGLPETDVTANETVHGLRTFHISLYLLRHLQLVGGVLVNEACLQLMLHEIVGSESESSLFAAFAVKQYEVAGNVLEFRLRTFLETVPGSGAQTRKPWRLPVAAFVLRKFVKGMNADQHGTSVAIIDFDDFAHLPVRKNFAGKTGELPDAVVDMHHIVSGLELHELLECERHL